MQSTDLQQTIKKEPLQRTEVIHMLKQNQLQLQAHHLNSSHTPNYRPPNQSVDQSSNHQNSQKYISNSTLTPQRLQSSSFLNLLTESDFSAIYHNSLLFYPKNKNNPYQISSTLTQNIKSLITFRQNKIYNLIRGDIESYFDDYILLRKSTVPTFSLSNSQSQRPCIDFQKMNVQIAASCVELTNQNVLQQITNGYLTNIFYHHNNIEQTKQRLQQNIENLRKNLSQDKIFLPDHQIIAYQNAEQRKAKKEHLYFQYMSLRKKPSSQDNVKSQQIRSFLQKINIQRSLTHNRYQKSLEKSEIKQKLYLENQAKQKAIKIKSNVEQSLKRHQQIKSQIQKQRILNESKIKDIIRSLSKYKKEKPIYLKFEQNFEKKEIKWKEQDRQILEDIHKERRAISLFEFQNHRKKMKYAFQQKKQATAQDLHRIKEEEKVIRSKLSHLFHSKHHEKIKQVHQMVSSLQKQTRKQRAQRALSYSVEVVSKLKPLIDPVKQMEIQKILERSQQRYEDSPKKIILKRKRKLKELNDNSVNIKKPLSQNIQKRSSQNEFMKKVQQTQVNVVPRNKKQEFKNNKSFQNQLDLQIKDTRLNQQETRIDMSEQQQIEIDVDPRKIGNHYLKQLRILNEGKPRKNMLNDTKSSQNKEKKVYDFSKEKKDHYKIKLTLSEWRKILINRQNQISPNPQKHSLKPFGNSQSIHTLTSPHTNKSKISTQKPHLLSSKQKSLILEPFINRIQADSNLYQRQKRQIPMKDLQRVISINRQLQKCYVESIKSKLQILKE